MAIPGIELKRKAYQLGLGAGKRATHYDAASRDKALYRFEQRYKPWGEMLANDWYDGWRDAELYREIAFIARTS